MVYIRLTIFVHFVSIRSFPHPHPPLNTCTQSTFLHCKICTENCTGIFTGIRLIGEMNIPKHYTCVNSERCIILVLRLLGIDFW